MPHSSTKGRFLEKCLKSDKVRTHGLADARNRQVPEDVIPDRIEPDPVIDVPEDDLWCILQRPLNHGYRSVYLLHGLR